MIVESQSKESNIGFFGGSRDGKNIRFAYVSFKIY